jgi:hypothetical protein
MTIPLPVRICEAKNELEQCTENQFAIDESVTTEPLMLLIRATASNHQTRCSPSKNALTSLASDGSKDMATT